MAPERELLLEIRNEQIAHGQRLERIERRLGVLGHRREVARQLAEEKAERNTIEARGSRAVTRFRRRGRDTERAGEEDTP